MMQRDPRMMGAPPMGPMGGGMGAPMMGGGPPPAPGPMAAPGMEQGMPQTPFSDVPREQLEIMALEMMTRIEELESQVEDLTGGMGHEEMAPVGEEMMF